MSESRRVGVVALGLLALVAARVAAADPLADAERAWSARAAVREDVFAAPALTEEAIAAYARAAVADPRALAPRWKQLRAMHFLVDFTSADETRKQEVSEQAVALASEWLALAALEAAPARDRAQLHFWSAIVWGVRGQRVGLLTLVREGIATRMREEAERALALDPTIERGGALRLLSRMHGSFPRLPFISGWVDREKTLPLAEKAYATDPGDPGNRLILAMALREHAPERADEVRALLESVSDATPRPELVVEDTSIIEEASRLLAEIET